MSDLEKSAEKALVRLKRPGLSVFAADVPSAVDVLNQAPQIRHPVVCVSTLARLREAFDVEQTFDPPHHTVWLPGIDEPTLELFALAFDEPVRREVLEDHARGL